MQFISVGNTSTISESQFTTPGFVPDSPYALVVDDDDAILSVVMLLLETEDHAAIGFSDSTKVIPFLEQKERAHLPAVVLLDLMMPVVSGYEIAARLSQDARYASIPIIIMTADNRVKGASAVPGASDWIGKPFQMATLLAKLERYLPPTAP
ncbi:MAG TPA: response regulator [Ktedonobacteraceae bacterium]|nr:response regulator [Ktedonobacteraceae bacterium]